LASTEGSQDEGATCQSEFRNFLELSYEELEELNLKAKEQRKKRVADRHSSRKSA
jgi:hypothetical protein